MKNKTFRGQVEISVHQFINAEEKTVEDCSFMKPHPYAVGWGSDQNPHNKGRRPFPCLSNIYIDWVVSSTLIIWWEIYAPANFVRPGLRQSNALRAFFLIHRDFGMSLGFEISLMFFFAFMSLCFFISSLRRVQIKKPRRFCRRGSWGTKQNRTAVLGFADRCLTTRPWYRGFAVQS